MSASAAERWRDALASWAIPKEILDAAPVNPWHFPVELFASRAEHAREELTPSNLRALEALPEGGTVLDVGCGGGAAALALVPRAGRLIGVDAERDMLDQFLDQARRSGVEARAIEGRWPGIALDVPAADVVTCHHVVYNAADLAGFACALSGHARRRVVVEMTAVHPQTNLNPLWLRFHGLRRPTEPTADTAVEVLRDAGLEPERLDWDARRHGGFARTEDLVAWVRRLLCLPAGRDPDVAQALAEEGMVRDDDGLIGLPDRAVVTLWWPGSAGR